MTEKVYSFIHELRKAQDEGRYTLCPRCGLAGTKGEVQSHACELLICEDCYRGEELLAKMNAPVEPTFWAVFESGSSELNPYRDLRAADAADKIEHDGTVKALLSIAKDWYADSEAEGNEALYRFRAFNECKGLTEIRFAKDGISRADFKAQDSEVVVSLRKHEGRIQYAINIRGVFD